MTSRLWRWVIAAAVLLLSLLPVAEWLGLPDDDLRPAWSQTAALWAWGSVLVLGLGVVADIVTRRRIGSWLGRVWAVYAALPERWVLVGLGLWVFVWGAAFSELLFARNPNLVDSIVQLFQAKIFASGRLWASPPPYPEFFITHHMVLTPDKWFSQYPLGHSAVFAAALRLGFPAWLVSPLLAAGAAVLTYAALRRGAGPRLARICALLLALSPFFLFMAGEQMNHVTVLFFLSAAFYGFVRGRESGSLVAFALCGFGLSLAAATRPLDAVAWAIPLAGLLVWERRWRGLVAAVAAGLPVTALLLAYNAATTSHPLLFGYQLLWGPAHGLGFHTDPWGESYTLGSALGFLNLDLRRLSLYAFEWPVPLAVLIGAGVLFWPRAVDRASGTLVATAVAVVGVNFFYWHHGEYLGPRMLYAAVPGLMVLTALSLGSLDRVAGQWRGAVRAGLLAALLVAATQTIPARAQKYANSFLSMKLHPDHQARAAGMQNAVIFVGESWASRMLALLWAWGVPPSEVERSYRTIDSCELEEVVQAAERRVVAGADSAEIRGWLRAELAVRRQRNGAVQLPRADTLPDHTLRLAPGRSITARCRELIKLDYEGFSVFTPFLPLNTPTLGGDLVFARDMRERDTLLMRLYPGRSFFLYTPGTAAYNVVPRFVPLEVPGPPATQP